MLMASGRLEIEFQRMQKRLDMTFDLRGRRAARAGLFLERAARRPVRVRFGSRTHSHVSYRLGLFAALGVDFLSSLRCSAACASYLRRTVDRVHAQPRGLG